MFEKYGKTGFLQNNHSKLEFCEFGGYVTAWKVLDSNQNWQNILYNEENIKRSGIPILFPFAGPLKNDLLNCTKTTLPQHGFGRLVNWKVIENDSTNKLQSEVALKLSSKDVDENWKKAYPFDFEAIIKLDISKKNCLKYVIEVTNLGKKNLPICPGLHPYFYLNHEQKKTLILNNLPNKRHPDNKNPIWTAEKTNWDTWEGFVELEANNGIQAVWENGKNPEKNQRKLLIETENNLEKILIWSGEGMQKKPYVCIEPIAKSFDNINLDPILVEPTKTWKTEINFTIDLL